MQFVSWTSHVSGIKEKYPKSPCGCNHDYACFADVATIRSFHLPGGIQRRLMPRAVLSQPCWGAGTAFSNQSEQKMRIVPILPFCLSSILCYLGSLPMGCLIVCSVMFLMVMMMVIMSVTITFAFVFDNSISIVIIMHYHSYLLLLLLIYKY